MSIIAYPELILIPLTLFLLLCFRSITTRKTTSFPTNWPLVGMLPGILLNRRRIHSYVTGILSESGGTFDFKFPSYLNMDMLFTSDPANIHHIFSTNFSNYPKGPAFRQYFDILGDGIFNADSEIWEFHRKTTLSIMTHPSFNSLLADSVWEKVDSGLLPVLDSFSDQSSDFDLQEVFQRFSFDNICKIVLDHDPRSLSPELPYVKCDKAFNDMIEALLYRHLLPEKVWKLQRWLGIGNEKKFSEAWKSFDEFIYPLVADSKEVGFGFGLLATFRKAYNERKNSSLRGFLDQETFLRDTALNLMLAGRDTTSTCLTWLFWLIATNPSTEALILEEIEKLVKEDRKGRLFNAEESKKLVYLHGALCESLRLFPPVALEHKAPIQPDCFPSGDYVKENTKIIVSFYSVGRMESVWGKDCLEFKPERWITPSGGIKHEPSYKFPAFNAGPRTCLGKEMAFVQMKMVAATILYRFKVRLVEGHLVSPRDSIILQAKDGLRVKLSKRVV